MIFSFLTNIFSYIFLMFGYISTSNLFPEPLSKSEEDYYLKKHFEGDKKAKDKLIEHNLRLVAHIAKKYCNNQQDMEEYISIGTIGLIKGINSFKEEKDCRLSTYCSRCVENEILMSIRAAKKTQSEVSMNNIIGTDKDGNDMELIDILENTEKDAIEHIYNKIITKQMLEYINTKLSERDRTIINLRYGLNGNDVKTQQEVADMLGISRSYISRIETKIQAKINRYLISG